MDRRHWIGATLLVAAAVWGCRMTPQPGLVACPLPSIEQVTQIRQIAPLGTPREEAIAALQKAGVVGNFGQNQSIFYCDIWQKEEERWHINVALLFDENGVLYATQPDLNGKLPESPKSTVGTAKLQTTSGDPFIE